MMKFTFSYTLFIDIRKKAINFRQVLELNVFFETSDMLQNVIYCATLNKLKIAKALWKCDSYFNPFCRNELIVNC